MTREKQLTIESAKKALKSLLCQDGLDKKIGINWHNFTKVENEKKTFRITAERLSLTSLIYVVENDMIEDVFFHPSVSPPKDGYPTTKMRYHIYIIFQ